MRGIKSNIFLDLFLIIEKKTKVIKRKREFSHKIDFLILLYKYSGIHSGHLPTFFPLKYPNLREKYITILN